MLHTYLANQVKKSLQKFIENDQHFNAAPTFI